MMNLPNHVAACIRRLENAGFPTYAVGGCVRDACLGLQPQDYDLCTAARPEQTEAVFSDHRLVLAGKKHGTVGVVTPDGVIEITTFRTEGSYEDSRHPDWVAFVPHVEDDLARRDFTVNAMAWSPLRGYCDPFGGREDLKNGILRAVGDPRRRFREDALRILRGMRFAVRFRLAVESETARAMEELAPCMDHLAKERIFDELCKLLPLLTAADLQQFAPLLTQVIPELAPTVHLDQKTPHHCHDLYTHIALVTEAVPRDLPLRWAALLHDIGKPPCMTLDENGQGHFLGHAEKSAQMAQEVLRRLKAPTALREQVVLLIEKHMMTTQTDKKLLRRRLSRMGETPFRTLLVLQEADCGSKGTATPEEMAVFSQIRGILEEIGQENACLTLKSLAVNGHDLMELGITGPAIGRTLNFLLEQVINETLPNTRQALLAAAESKIPS